MQVLSLLEYQCLCCIEISYSDYCPPPHHYCCCYTYKLPLVMKERIWWTVEEERGVPGSPPKIRVRTDKLDSIFFFFFATCSVYPTGEKQVCSTSWNSWEAPLLVSPRASSFPRLCPISTLDGPSPSPTIKASLLLPLLSVLFLPNASGGRGLLPTLAVLVLLWEIFNSAEVIFCCVPGNTQN